MKIEDMRKEYSRYQQILKKRTMRMIEGQFSWTKTVRNNIIRMVKEFPDIEDMPGISKSKLAEKLAKIKDFYDSPTSSTRGLQKIRRESIETLHDKGYDFVNMSNWREWTEFLDWWRDTHPDKQHGSPTREEMKSYLDNIKTGMTPEEAKEAFEEYENNKA